MGFGIGLAAVVLWGFAMLLHLFHTRPDIVTDLVFVSVFLFFVFVVFFQGAAVAFVDRWRARPRRTS